MINLIFIHGLNNNNSIWDDLSKEFNKDYQIHYITLLGHDGDDDTLKNMDEKDIVKDLVVKINKIKGPKNIIAYSLGALTFYKAYQDNCLEDIHQIILLAPAFKVKYKRTLNFLTKFSLNQNYKSIAPKEFRKYDLLPVNIYRVLLKLGNEISFDNQKLKALIFCSSKDQLVDYKYLEKISKKLKCELIDLKRPTSFSHPAFQHMIFNKRFLGDFHFKLLKSRILSYFQI